MTFTDLHLCAPVQKAVRAAGYERPTPIQQQAIPMVLAGHDVFGCAQTGTGKTAAFALPILHKLHEDGPQRGGPSVVILAPTRELAVQIGESFLTYGKQVRARYLTVFGGVSIGPQISTIRRGIDVIVATPGRLIDLLDQRAIRLDRVNTLVLDEADRMLDMGFQPQINRIISEIPKERQTLFFSATVPPEIRKLADSILRTPTHVAVAPVSSATETVTQHRYIVPKANKRKMLLHLLDHVLTGSVLVFTRTKRGADRVMKDLTSEGVTVNALHGDKSQAARQKALKDFKAGRIRVLVATDIASRGIDISELPYVINYDVPESPETYVHRIGRTGRAGTEGLAITLSSGEDEGDVRAIEKLIKTKIPVIHDHPYHKVSAEDAAKNRTTEQPRTRTTEQPNNRKFEGRRTKDEGRRTTEEGRSSAPRSNRSSGSRPGSQRRDRSRY